MVPNPIPGQIQALDAGRFGRWTAGKPPRVVVSRSICGDKIMRYHHAGQEALLHDAGTPASGSEIHNVFHLPSILGARTFMCRQIARDVQDGSVG